MPIEYRHNHYVPVWYQKRFIPLNQQNQELFYLDLNPGTYTDPRGVSHPKKAINLLGPKCCFAENNLYTTRFENVESVEIEKRFFGSIDRNGRKAVDYYANFAHPWNGEDFFKELLMYMSTQKLRTPKGLNWLSAQAETTDRNIILSQMLKLRQLYCATWADCVWLIADASSSETKFIISDHPITVYNRKCGPRSSRCRGNNDPDIWLNGTHTIFPLSLDKVLILTNLSWVRNPYQSETSFRPNPYPFRSTIFKITDIQTLRHLSEQEVREINFIIKSRALKYVGAAKKEWLYPERYITKSNWYTYGHGYLLMPDPRPITLGGELLWGNGDGTGGAMDEYGRFPWQKDYNKEGTSLEEGETLDQFKSEFARLFGPYRRGRSFNSMFLDNEKDNEEYHQYHLNLEQERKKRKNKK